MKLILTHEVSNLGAPGDIVEVKGGYARNFLLPRNYAIVWTKGAAKQVESIKAAREARAVHDLETARGIKSTLEAKPITVQVNAGEGGRLFGAVTVSDIAAAMDAAGAPVDKRRIDVGNPIKSLGTHQVTVRVHPEVSATVTLNVVAAK
ncbi:50S ribosomal protein L9 [Aeromicrobium phragmitis]|uniref:Large ribosomal subunit protein bL9 n=1 Tax=Aeromicrobium phragmitis TaxID=2478914 RepID=A0A3L8PPX9_9ACTN|nr:50S ribosomal protein L9 [Aeromicrobium phragmitis]RLV57244.1 50S ribosomal protein L9 [Aeromicrobium phragmitis]